MVALTPKAFSVLQYLVAHAGQLVTKEALLATVWPEMAVSEAVLKVCLSEIRKALGDVAKTPRFIATLHRRGYRFIAPVRVLPVDREERDTRIILGVLPFENLIGDADRDYLADSLTEEVIASLGQINPDRLAVIGRTSMMPYKRTTKSIAEIGRQLNAGYLIESSIRAEGGRLRVTAKLIRVLDQAATWSASFDAEPVSLLAFQCELSTAIAEQIRIRLTPECLDALARRLAHARSVHAPPEGQRIPATGVVTRLPGAPNRARGRRRRTQARPATGSGRGARPGRSGAAARCRRARSPRCAGRPR